MHDNEWLNEHFQANHDRLRGVAYRLLGSGAEADDAVQEAWLRISRSDASAVENLAGWLTTIVSRVCLDMLRSRESRREESLDARAAAVIHEPRPDPERETLMGDSVGIALLVVLDTLAPVERTTFVLHEMFAVPFDEIASIIGRTPAAARQIASRARKRVRGPARQAARRPADISEQRALVDAFLGALRAGDLDALLRVLDPDFVIRADTAVAGSASEVRGAAVWAPQAIMFARALQHVQPALIDGVPGLVFAPKQQLMRVLRFQFANQRIMSADVIGDATQLSALTITIPDL